MTDNSKKLELIQSLFAINGFDCPFDSARTLLRFSEILEVWNEKVNLTAHRTLDDIVLKDFIDATYFDMYRITYRNDSSETIDLACGAGFIGITVSILHPEASVTFLDSNRKRISFVRKVISELGLKNASVEWGRGEEVKPHLSERFDAVVSRASFDLARFEELANQYVQNSAHAFFMGGSDKGYASSHGKSGLIEVKSEEYVLKPAGYRRKIVIFKKGAPETGST